MSLIMFWAQNHTQVSENLRQLLVWQLLCYSFVMLKCDIEMSNKMNAEIGVRKWSCKHNWTLNQGFQKMSFFKTIWQWTIIEIQKSIHVNENVTAWIYPASYQIHL